jgi:hypothetical protein
MPGAEARSQLLALACDPPFRHLRERLRHLARGRAALDAEFLPYRAVDIVAMESRLEAPPNSRDALFTVMLDRLSDLQHDIAHHDFSDRRTLQRITDESEMQRTLARRLEATSRSSYTVVRESEVADRKRTDIVLAAAGSLQKAVIEVKLADMRWTLSDLEHALRNQLVALYTRHENCRAGCLLLSYDGRRSRWASSGRSLDWNGLLEHLATVAARIEKDSGSTIKVAVVGFDLRDTQLPASRSKTTVR